jgi:hypothetical protein
MASPHILTHPLNAAPAAIEVVLQYLQNAINVKVVPKKDQQTTELTVQPTGYVYLPLLLR